MNVMPLASRLPSVDPGVARAQTRLIAALDGEPAEGGLLRAGAVPGGDHAAIVFATAFGTVEIAPLLADGGVPRLLADDGQPDAVPALAALAAIEPLVAAVERRLGTALSPVAVAPLASAIRVRVDLVEADAGFRHAAVVGLADGVPLPAPSRRLSAWAARLRLPLVFRAAGPALPPARVAALAAGDLVIVGGSALAGHLDAGGRRRPGVFRPAAAELTITALGSSRVTDPDETTGDLDPGLRLPLTLRIDGGSATLGEVAGLAPGSVVPLGLEGATLPVTLEISGSPIAVGELVAVGDAYGVLITRRLGGAG